MSADAKMNADWLRSLTRKQRIEAMKSLAFQVGESTQSCPRSFLNGFVVAMSMADSQVSIEEMREVNEAIERYFDLDGERMEMIELPVKDGERN